MASEDRPAAPAVKSSAQRTVLEALLQAIQTPSVASVETALWEQPHSFAFFQAVRLLLQAMPHAAPPGSPPRLVTASDMAGYDLRTERPRRPFSEEALYFRAHTSLAFPTADIVALARAAALSPDETSTPRADTPQTLPPVHMIVNFLGLYGPSSPLPTFYTEALLTTGEEEPILRHFLDLFHHRLLSLFYRCWEKYRYYVQYQPAAEDTFSSWLFALIGVSSAERQQRTDLAWHRLLPYLGLLTMRTTSGAVVARLVAHYFRQIPVRVDECIGRWVPVALEQRLRLGEANQQLGEDTILGERFYDRSGKFRLTIGPVSWEVLQRFLPTGLYAHEIRALLYFILRDPLEFDLECQVYASEVPPLRLQDDSPCRLGWSTWLGAPREDTVSVSFPGRDTRVGTTL